MSLSGDIISDMELDASIEAIGEIAGSIDLDGSGTTPTITASATVSPDPGIPACDVVKTGTDEYPNFTFNFSGLKGDQGEQGVPGQNGADGSDGVTPNISATASVSNTSGIPVVNVTKTGSETTPNFDFAFSNLKGDRGEKGEKGDRGEKGDPGQNGTYPNITATASATQTTGIASVVVTKTGSDDAPNFDFAFSNIKGEQGIQGLNGRDGTDGVTPIVSATASVDDAVGIPNVVITRSGTTSSPNFDFAFHNLKGTQGSPGEGVPSGGAAGQVLAKQSSTDYDADWESLTIPSTAAEITFDNTGTGMTATDVQDAVTELKSNLTELLDGIVVKHLYIDASDSETVTMPANSRGIAIFSSATENARGIMSFNITRLGTLSTTKLNGLTIAPTFSFSSGTLTITNTASSFVEVMVFFTSQPIT